jgi:hypothetical protein
VTAAVLERHMALEIHLPEGHWGPDARSAAAVRGAPGGVQPPVEAPGRWTLAERRWACKHVFGIGPIDADEGGEFVACVRLHGAPPKAGVGGRDVRA